MTNKFGYFFFYPNSLFSMTVGNYSNFLSSMIVGMKKKNKEQKILKEYYIK